MKGVERYKVRLLPHNPDWDKEFLTVEKELRTALGCCVLEVQHVGSTAIPTISAKPILDIAVLMRTIGAAQISALEGLGYDYRGMQNNNASYHLFVLRGENQTSLRHIHCYDKRCEGFDLLVAFRDYLRLHKTAALQYENLKKKLSEQYPNDRASYTKGKAAFIQSIYDKILSCDCSSAHNTKKEE